MQREAGWEDVLSNTFIEDQAYWRKWWRALFQPKANRKRNGFLLLAFGWIAFAYLLLLAVFEKLKIVEPDGVISYEDARNFFLMLAALLSPFLAFLGFHIADRRLHEQEKQTALQRETGLQQRYVDAITLLSKGKSYQKIAGINALRYPAIAENEVLMASAASTLTAHIRSRGKAGTEENKGQRERRLREVRESMKTLFFLEETSGKPTRYRNGQLHFTDLDLSGMEPRSLPTMVSIFFENCDFCGCDFSGTKLRHVIFLNCHLEGAHFHVPDGFGVGAGLSSSHISGTMVFINKNLKKSRKPKYSSCKYDMRRPPFVHRGATLPTPWLYPHQVSDDERYMTLEEAETFWSQPENDKFRPRDGDGNLIEIVYPDDS